MLTISFTLSTEIVPPAKNSEIPWKIPPSFIERTLLITSVMWVEITADADTTV